MNCQTAHKGGQQCQTNARTLGSAWHYCPEIKISFSELYQAFLVICVIVTFHEILVCLKKRTLHWLDS